MRLLSLEASGAQQAVPEHSCQSPSNGTPQLHRLLRLVLQDTFNIYWYYLKRYTNIISDALFIFILIEYVLCFANHIILNRGKYKVSFTRLKQTFFFSLSIPLKRFAIDFLLVRCSFNTT